MSENDKLPKEDEKDVSSSVNDEDQNEHSDDKEQDDKTDEEKLKDLMNAIEELEKKSGNKKRKKPVLFIEFGGVFHRNPLLNYLMYYTLNLVVIYGVITLFDFGAFSPQLWVPLAFVLIYTAAETFFRQYIMLRHFRFALRSLGFIFFFGYLTLFYLIDVYLFGDLLIFYNETLLVVFVGMFVVFRYLLSYIIKYVILKQRSF